MKKNLNRRVTGTGLLFAGIILSACEHSVSTETIVHPDGSLDKIIILEVKDSAKTFQNILTEEQAQKWDRTELDSARYMQRNLKDSSKYILLRKNFPSAEDANNELAAPSDSLFRITSKFEKRFRWFYTYIDYSDTYHMLNHMKMNAEDYFTPEDFAFIDRLPAEGNRISPADSLYLALLNEKIYDHYGARAYFEEYYDILIQLVKTTPNAAAWTDSVLSMKQEVYAKVLADKDVPDDFILVMADTLGIPLDNPKESPLYKSLLHKLETKVTFITWASEGKYQHAIQMPGTLVETNADSVAGNKVYWRPSPVKFTLRDFTMHARARMMNYWAVAVSAVVVLLTGYLFLRRRRMSAP